MLGIQKEPYATFFAEDFAKSEMKREFSLNSLDEKIARRKIFYIIFHLESGHEGDKMSENIKL